MIPWKDINPVDGSGQDGMTPNKPGPVRDQKEYFDKMLTESIQEIQEKEIHFKNYLFDLNDVSPVTQPAVSRASGDSGNFSSALAVVLRHEGSAYVKRDAGRGSSKFGILQSTAREYGYKGNVKYMTRADAEAIYHKLWEKSGASSLPYPLSLIHFDTYVNSPAAARKFLRESGGDPETYLNLRAQRYHHLAKLRPARFKRYLNGWMNRIASLRTITSEYMIAKNLQDSGEGVQSANPGDILL